MEFYFPTLLAGAALVALTAWLMKAEETRRKAHFRRSYHTILLSHDTNQARKLYRTHYIIGRRKRRCDIYLKDDKSVSKVHAVLWHDGSNYCIAPSRDLEILRPSAEEEALPEVYVNGELVPEEGTVLVDGDKIRLGNSRFELIDTKGKGEK